MTPSNPMPNPHPKPSSSPSPEPEWPVDDDVIRAKYEAMHCPGFVVTFDPHEADALGAFVEDAMTEEEALESAIDLDWTVPEIGP